MSHFATYNCQVSNVEFVKRALAEMGLGFKENQVITDWAKQQRHVDLAVVKDGKVLPIGWQIKEGNMELVAEWYQVPLREKEFTNKVSQLHSKYQVLETCEENRWNVDLDDIVVNEAGEIEITATQYQ